MKKIIITAIMLVISVSVFALDVQVDDNRLVITDADGYMIWIVEGDPEQPMSTYSVIDYYSAKDINTIDIVDGQFIQLEGRVDGKVSVIRIYMDGTIEVIR